MKKLTGLIILSIIIINVTVGQVYAAQDYEKVTVELLSSRILDETIDLYVMNDNIYMSLDAACGLTGSIGEKVDDNTVKITHGTREIEMKISTNTVSESNMTHHIDLVIINDLILVSAFEFIDYLGGSSNFENGRLTVYMPTYTFWEAMNFEEEYMCDVALTNVFADIEELESKIQYDIAVEFLFGDGDMFTSYDEFVSEKIIDILATDIYSYEAVKALEMIDNIHMMKFADKNIQEYIEENYTDSDIVTIDDVIASADEFAKHYLSEEGGMDNFSLVLDYASEAVNEVGKDTLGTASAAGATGLNVIGTIFDYYNEIESIKNIDDAVLKMTQSFIIYSDLLNIEHENAAAYSRISNAEKKIKAVKEQNEESLNNAIEESLKFSVELLVSASEAAIPEIALGKATGFLLCKTFGSSALDGSSAKLDALIQSGIQNEIQYLKYELALKISNEKNGNLEDIQAYKDLEMFYILATIRTCESYAIVYDSKNMPQDAQIYRNRSTELAQIYYKLLSSEVSNKVYVGPNDFSEYVAQIIPCLLRGSQITGKESVMGNYWLSYCIDGQGNVVLVEDAFMTNYDIQLEDNFSLQDNMRVYREEGVFPYYYTEWGYSDNIVTINDKQFKDIGDALVCLTPYSQLDEYLLSGSTHLISNPSDTYLVYKKEPLDEFPYDYLEAEFIDYDASWGFISASSYLDFSYNYEPLNMCDNNPATAWVEGVDGNGEGEKIFIGIIDDGYSVNGIAMINGYAKSEDLYYKNARVKSATVKIMTSTQTHEIDINLNDGEMDYQTILFGDTFNDVESVEIIIKEGYDGSKYKDLCISEVRLLD